MSTEARGGVAVAVRCPECGRVFDLFNAIDADELTHGHDCETSSEIA